MITRFQFKGPRRILSFDYLGPPWVFVVLISLLGVALALVLSFLKLLK
jgi:hypothetical protein